MEEKKNEKGFQGLFKGIADSVKKGVQDIKLPDLKEIKLPEMPKVNLPDIKEKLPELKTKLQEIKLPEVFHGPANKPAEPDLSGEIRTISAESAMKIIYYLMAVDGTVYHDEEDKFNDIGKELDPHFDINKNGIELACQAQMNKLIDPDDRYAVLQDGVEEAIAAGRNAPGSMITPRLLVWNMLTIAYSDGNYDENERNLIKYIVRKTNIDKAIFLEMESSFLTLMDLEKELAWIKSTDRPYLTIEAMVNEIADRKTVVFESVKDLIAF